MSDCALQEYEAFLRQLEDIVSGGAPRNLGMFSTALSVWLTASSGTDIVATKNLLTAVRTLFVHKTALDRRRWVMSWRANRPRPMFETEFLVPVVDQKLDETITYTRTVFDIELYLLEASPVDVLEVSIRALLSELGAVLPINMPMGRLIEFEAIS